MDYSEASKLLRYDEVTGALYWLSDMRVGFKGSVLAHKAGDLAKCKRKDGRSVVRLKGKLYMAYRVAWLLKTGAWPAGEIDHKNGDSSDDSFKNLRDVSRRTNTENRHAANSKKLSSKFLGVYANKANRSQPWRALISANGKQISLGAFDTEEEAYAAYLGAKRVIHSGCTL